MSTRLAALLLILVSPLLWAQFDRQYEILVVNDDGYSTEGIRELAKALQRLGRVTVVAPRTNASGVGHGITYKRAIEYKLAEHIGQSPVYWVDALPSSCTRWALDTLFKDDKPDVVVSGINRGINVGYGVYYSGTVAAAREATFAGVPAIAASSDAGPETDYQGAAEFVATVCEEQLQKGKPFFLNINFPAAKIDENVPVTYTRLTKARWNYEYVNRTSPRDDQPYFWIVSENKASAETGSDQWAVFSGHISITPLKIEVTDFEALDNLEKEREKQQKQTQEPVPLWPR